MSDLWVFSFSCFSFSWFGFTFLLKRNCDFYMYVICEGYLWICIFFLMESSRVLGECEEGLYLWRTVPYLSLSLFCIRERNGCVFGAEERGKRNGRKVKWEMGLGL